MSETNRITVWAIGLLATVLPVTVILWAADAPFLFNLLIFTEQFLAFVLAMTLALVFLCVRIDRRSGGPVPWYDISASVLGFVSASYVAVVYPTLAMELAFTPVKSVIVATVLLVLIVEAVRRVTGTALAILIVLFIAYGLFGHLLPGPLAGRNMRFERFVTLIVLDPNGILGTPLKIASTVVVVFIFFGKTLGRSGGTDYFTDLSAAIMGRFRGGSAKISIVASALFGSISGSAVSNVATTGIVTIPLMRRAGFSATTAAGIEAVASTGGQLMPPVMGAAAFLMAEFLEITYAEVVIAALVPALLYFLALFIQADLRAARDGILGVSSGVGMAQAWTVLVRGWIFPIPFAVLIGGLFWLNLSPQEAGLYAAAAMLVLALTIGGGAGKLRVRDALATIPETGRSVLDIIVITAAAGIVIGTLNYTGLSFGLTLVLVRISENSVLVLLIVAALVSIVLGMGMPTVGVYVLLAVLIAPSMIEVGFDSIAVHLFILYFGMMSMITPPIAIAAFAAAGLAKADPMKTGWEAMRFGWMAYVIPFVFVFSPGLLMRGDWLLIGLSAVGVWFGSVATVGFLYRPLGPPIRLLFAAVALAVFLPSAVVSSAPWINGAGAIAGVILVLWLRARDRGE
ncbi:MAG: TRAP transporter fused permease subunit [Alphaproteobacteria bacterium]|nr:MAG: TRAP transporter fused permease subunit [Alphaproteobacteria bacterium]